MENRLQQPRFFFQYETVSPYIKKKKIDKSCFFNVVMYSGCHKK